jgi:tight adherence protein B
VVVIAAGSTGPAGLPLWAVCAIAFVALLGLALVGLFVPLAARRRDAKRMRLEEVQRYRVLGAEGLPARAEASRRENAVARRALSMVDSVLRARGRRGDVIDRLDCAGLRIRPEEWVAIRVIAPVVLGAVGLLLTGIGGLLIGLAVGFLACYLFLKVKISRRRRLFESQLPDALQLLSGALRTGFALNQALQTVVREGTDPVGTEFGRALHEVRLGANLEDALEDVATRMASYDLKLVVMAIRTAREVGGNLAEVLETTVATMRERTHLRGQVRTLSAEGRFSAKVLIALPLLLGSYLLAFKRDYISPLYTTPIGIVLLIIGIVLLVVGALWLTRMTKIEV